MSNKTTRLVGVSVLLATLLLSWLLLPALFPTHGSPGNRATMRQVALGHLLAGAVGGFGVALVVWPFRRTDA